MEQEQSLSKFKVASKRDFIAASDFSEKQESTDFQYRFPNQDNAFSHLAKYFYHYLDGLTGRESFFLSEDHSPVGEPYAKLLNFLHSRGIVETAGLRDERYNDAPFFYRFSIKAAYPSGITDGRQVEMSGLACSHDVSALFSKGMGEFLERYFLTLYHRKNLIYAAPETLRKSNVPFINLSQLDGFSSEQRAAHPKRQWSEASVLGWEKTVRIATKGNFLIPAQMIYWNYVRADEINEPFIREPNTNGNGGMFTKEEAILAGIYELIERDSFLIYWLNTVSPPQIDLESVPDESFQAIVRESKRYGFRIHCLNTTLDTAIPSFIAVIIDPSGQGPYFTCGGGCSLNPIKALLGALEEAWSVYLSQRDYPLFKLPSDYIPFNSPLNREERMYVAANPTYAEHYNFFLSGPVKKLSDSLFLLKPRFSSVGEELDFVVRMVEREGEGYEIYAHLVQHPLLKKLGYHVARVVIPAMVPLYLYEPNAPIASPRLQTIPYKIGFSVKPSLNPWPHPFP